MHLRVRCEWGLWKVEKGGRPRLARTDDRYTRRKELQRIPRIEFTTVLPSGEREGDAFQKAGVKILLATISLLLFGACRPPSTLQTSVSAPWWWGLCCLAV